MSCESFDPACPGCRPAMMASDGKKLPDDHPAMKVVLALWDVAPRPEQEACWRVWVKNSRSDDDMRLANEFFKKVQAKLDAV